MLSEIFPNAEAHQTTESKNLSTISTKNRRLMSNLISAVAWVKRGVAAPQPHKYVLDDNELQRVSALARIELEDARVEMERAHKAAQEMGKNTEDDEVDAVSIDGQSPQNDDGDANWVESVFGFLLKQKWIIDC